MKSNKKPITIISIILILVLAGCVFVYLYLETDIFKSSKELFGKYFNQNVETFQKMTELQTVNAYENISNEKKYETETKINLVHSEGGEVSNPLNDLSAKLNIQEDKEEQYVYLDGQILYGDDKYLEAEILKDQEMYGIRFTDAFKEFVTIKKDELQEIKETTNLNIQLVENVIKLLDGELQVQNEEGMILDKEKYLNIITPVISSGTFSKQKNAIITYNNATTKTNAYTVTLSSEQVENICIEILNTIKDEDPIIDIEILTKLIENLINQIKEELEIPSVTITVYEQKQKTIRTELKIGQYKILIENTEQDGEDKIKIEYSNLESDEITQCNIEIIKKKSQNYEELKTIVNIVNGEEEHIIELSNEMELVDNTKLQINTEIGYKKDITTIWLIVKNETEILEEIENVEKFTAENNRLLTKIPKEKRNEFIDVLEKFVAEKTNTRIKLLQEKLGMANAGEENLENVTGGSEMPQAEINKFNSKFEFYTGNEVSAENVKLLLDIAKNNMKAHTIMENTNSGDIEIQEPKTNIILYIEKDQIYEDRATKILEKIDDNKKYKVLIFYKEGNGLIDYITITEV